MLRSKHFEIFRSKSDTTFLKPSKNIIASPAQVVPDHQGWRLNRQSLLYFFIHAISNLHLLPSYCVVGTARGPGVWSEIAVMRPHCRNKILFFYVLTYSRQGRSRKWEV